MMKGSRSSEVGLWKRLAVSISVKTKSIQSSGIASFPQLRRFAW